LVSKRAHSCNLRRRVSPGPSTTGGPGPRPLVAEHGCGDPRARGTDGGQIGDGGASVPVIFRGQTGTDAPPSPSSHGYPCLPPMRWSAEGASRTPPSGSKAGALQPTPSPNRSPDPARQPALAPGLSLVPHGCGDPLIRLVQAPQLNRVLEGWCALHAAEAAPCVREAGGQGRLSCRGRGPVVRVTAGFKGAGVSKEGPRSFVRPLFGRSTAKRSNEGVAGGLRPPASAEGGAAFGRPGLDGVVGGASAPYLAQCPSRHSAQRPMRSPREYAHNNSP
jgi:hypothetical protein